MSRNLLRSMWQWNGKSALCQVPRLGSKYVSPGSRCRPRPRQKTWWLRSPMSGRLLRRRRSHHWPGGQRTSVAMQCGHLDGLDERGGIDPDGAAPSATTLTSMCRGCVEPARAPRPKMFGIRPHRAGIAEQVSGGGAASPLFVEADSSPDLRIKGPGSNLGSPLPSACGARRGTRGRSLRRPLKDCRAPRSRRDCAQGHLVR